MTKNRVKQKKAATTTPKEAQWNAQSGHVRFQLDSQRRRRVPLASVRSLKRNGKMCRPRGSEQFFLLIRRA